MPGAGVSVLTTKYKFLSLFFTPLEIAHPQALRARLSRRGTEAPEEAERRLAKAAEEVATARAAGCYDAEVVNDDLGAAINQVVSLIETRRKRND
jgi:guanylate kinase